MGFGGRNPPGIGELCSLRRLGWWFGAGVSGSKHEDDIRRQEPLTALSADRRQEPPGAVEHPDLVRPVITDVGSDDDPGFRFLVQARGNLIIGVTG